MFGVLKDGLAVVPSLCSGESVYRRSDATLWNSNESSADLKFGESAFLVLAKADLVFNFVDLARVNGGEGA